jgi:hypothetical protein
MGLTPWEKYKEKNGVTFLDALSTKAERCTEEETQERLNICRSCSEFFKPTQQCKRCGCIMPAKASLKRANCPLGKW